METTQAMAQQSAASTSQKSSYPAYQIPSKVSPGSMMPLEVRWQACRLGPQYLPGYLLTLDSPQSHGTWTMVLLSASTAAKKLKWG